MINLRTLLSALVVLVLFACGSQPATDETSAANEQQTQPVDASTETVDDIAVTAVTVDLNEDMIAKLQAADEADGNADNVVHKCGGCNLGMDGKTEYAIQAGDYEMHFCSDYCKNRFVEKPADEIAGLPAPTEGP